jgi:hypothetical protein
MSAAGESRLCIVIATRRQRIAALDDLGNAVAGAASGAAGEHGNLRIRRKETCSR